MIRVIRQQQAYMRQQNKLWPSTMTLVPKDEWPKTLAALRMPPFSVFRSCNFVAQVFDEALGARRISVQRTMIDDDGEWIQRITWDDLMGVKAECGYGNCWAVEIYPPNDDVVNVANMRHLWLIPEAPLFAWKKGESCVWSAIQRSTGDVS